MIPVLGSLFRSKSFQKNETELIFIVTAQLVKPVNRDDSAADVRGVDGLKNGSPLGLEPKTEEIQGRTGLSVTGQNTEGTPTATPAVAAPAKGAEPAGQPESKGRDRKPARLLPVARLPTLSRVNPTLPTARTMPMDVDPAASQTLIESPF